MGGVGDAAVTAARVPRALVPGEGSTAAALGPRPRSPGTRDTERRCHLASSLPVHFPVHNLK